MKEAVEQYLDGRVRRHEITARTARTHRTALRGFVEACGDKTVDKITVRDVRRWLGTGEHWSAGTRRARFSVVRAWCQHLVLEGELRTDPFRNMKAPRVPRRSPRALHRDQIVAVLEACPDLRAQLIVMLMVQQGLRRKEVARLQIGMIDFRNRTMLVVGKGDHERMLPITDETYETLIRYLAQFPSTTGPLVRSYQYPTHGLGPDRIYSIVVEAMREAGVKLASLDGVTPHALRHTAATDMLRHGAHVRDVQAALGHQHLSTTEIYLPHLVGTLDGAMNGRRYGVTQAARWGATG